MIKIEEHKSYKYAQSVINREVSAPKYVIKQCGDFIDICDNKSEKYFIDEEKLNKIDNILKLLIMPRGLKPGESIYECSCGYQWLIYAVLCVVYRENPDKRRYETIILEVGRKNFKTFTVATIFAVTAFFSYIAIESLMFSWFSSMCVFGSKNVYIYLCKYIYI